MMLQKWRGELGWPAGKKQATKFAANFQLFISLIDLGIYLSFLLFKYEDYLDGWEQHILS
jgi:hypothetical protein